MFQTPITIYTNLGAL